MTLGCRLEPSFLAYMRRTFRDSGIMRVSFLQLHTALYTTANGYKNDGTPYDFGNPDLYSKEDYGGPSERDKIYPGSMLTNVPAPHAFHAPNAYQAGRDLDLSARTREFPDNVCGGCGDDKDESGKELMVCTRCKKKRYCGKDCQKKHWKLHKGVCKA